ncbi:putative capsule polysaccharide exporter [Sulfitobacter noctilucicola]|uniref:Polysaccharide export outer membrane protein n=1 Tax=Sulfitobacter noctilucicola TaxID=1342301 RepID=A0A7W6M616_9RHOB|nr:polysaccharide biosynthesis/export family protein [Sulfitobacter noctilucicola]KIN62724.1 putative capsule polysaccharide exporter [Sulfitobacter noctilucicola]MBB4172743.1 polysaccharide export outer membrane protein [Sulfitobacter noctilucicola]
MFQILRFTILIVLSLTLTACNLPRGAALQSEIIKTSKSEEPQVAVYPITKDLLPRYAKWPSTGDVKHYSWIGKRRGPIGRVILPGDSVSIAVWDSSENSLLTAREQKVAQLQVSRVSTNGSIFLPYVGSINVGGMTEHNARQKIQDAFTSVSPSAQVQLSAAVGKRHSVDVVSGVNNPGSYPIEERDMTVLSALTLGGGAKESFENPQIRLLRRNDIYAISLGKLLRSPQLDTTLVSGDKIVVAEDERYFLALGATGKEEIITFPSDTVTAIDAVTLMGGLSDSRANIQGILILREYSARALRSDGVSGPANQRVVFTMDLSTADGLFSAGKFHINPKDVVYATESPVSNVRTVFGLIGSAFGVVATASSN